MKLNTIAKVVGESSSRAQGQVWLASREREDARATYNYELRLQATMRLAAAERWESETRALLRILHSDTVPNRAVIRLGLTRVLAARACFYTTASHE